MRNSLRRWCLAGPPLLWLCLFTFLPLLIVLKISLATTMVAIPPYSPLFVDTPDGLAIDASLANYAFLLEDRLYGVAYLNSVRIAAVSTLICALVGYPMAYAMARARPSLRGILVVLVILPFWSSFLIRVYAWMGILNSNGLINTFLLDRGLIDAPLRLLHTEFAVHLGIVYAYLPFMVLPLYAVLERLDWSLVEAAKDLGARPWRAFLSVTLPLSAPGLAAGALLVFVPALGEFVIPDLLGGSDVVMMGKILWIEFFSNRDWPLAAAVAVAMLLLVVVPALVLGRLARAREDAAT